uniref:Uncharacterized protein n=1 Tax=Anopheles coluzzii TaxID=1518534 RepID=A0A8W7PG89_ANOCL
MMSGVVGLSGSGSVGGGAGGGGGSGGFGSGNGNTVPPNNTKAAKEARLANVIINLVSFSYAMCSVYELLLQFGAARSGNVTVIRRRMEKESGVYDYDMGIYITATIAIHLCAGQFEPVELPPRKDWVWASPSYVYRLHTLPVSNCLAAQGEDGEGSFAIWQSEGVKKLAWRNARSS